MALTPGTRLGHYQVLAAIGAGGMGEVYRARDTKLGRDVAIKIFDYESAGRPRGLTWTRDGSSLIVASQEFPGDIVMFDMTSPK